VNVNGERSQYFSTYQGLRQGDPLSPMIFNLVAEVLATLMKKAARQGKVTGVMTHLIPKGITHIQYADDTIIMVEGDDKSVTHMKLILYCFEWLFGLKINYHKSEAYVFGMSEGDQVRIANMLNYNLGRLHMKYLGILVNDVKLGMVPLSSVAKKVSKRVPPWKGKHMSSRGRLILTNNCLSSLPTYTMGFYLVPLGIHRKMDHVRAKFFWRGAGGEFKCHMMRWSAVCHPKMFGGRGIINTHIFNECLMVK
jgi:hypothetical protein